MRVRYHECDGQGIVFNANYLVYADICGVELERELFGSHDAFIAHGVETVVAEANVKFRAPARFDDELVVSAYVTHLGTTSLVFEYEITRGDEVLAVAVLRYVFIDPATFTKTPPPEAVRKAYADVLR
ncbi:acyl-CoA thioester hydrolase [Amycolatopsis xylanica]|uniref:Acyl-CoA thioester hydrolase n=1 Tax=Amycolatopsis xylanica TaxID=589385 RepID=A0A1H2U9J6_9PSEU|nr:thioesterase family protein [Amycolatopsis xylanica]SDW52872.1 acyl-CoA thioester hydrolase [Amycolatopsis xylanica]